MKIKFGIMLKLFVFYFFLIAIFFGTILVLFVQIHHILRISEDIVNVHYKVSSASKKMIDSLVWMAESESKYNLLKKEDYKEYFLTAKKEFEASLEEILSLQKTVNPAENPWRELQRDYVAQAPTTTDVQQDDDDMAQVLWIAEDVIRDWIQRISEARADNEHQIEGNMRILNQWGRNAFHWGILGLAVSAVLGLMGSIFLTRSMNRPLRELRQGIHTVSSGGLKEPISVNSKDEFGELAAAFNEMGLRLQNEERMRSDFISMLSHEIRTPLTSIRESINLIAEEVMGTINEKQRRFLQIASREMERITALLRHLLQVSRLEAGGLHMAPRPIEPLELISGSVYRATPAAEAKNIQIETHVDPHAPLILGDFENLQQVLLNLLGNAIKYSPRDSRITLSVQRNSSIDANGLIFSVSDHGPGIPENERELVFHKYFRSAGVRDEVDGAGLGLSISKHIVEAHGGRIWVSNAREGGSTFSFTIPFLSEAEENAQAV